MSFEEKTTWVSSVVTVLVLAVYSCFILGQLGTVPVTLIAYQWPMILTIAAIIGMTIVGTILMSIAAAVSSGITGNDLVKEIDRTDERDRQINLRGEQIGFYVSSIGALGVIALAMLRYDQFWIANALYLTFMVGGLVSLVAKLIAYRRGF